MALVGQMLINEGMERGLVKEVEKVMRDFYSGSYSGKHFETAIYRKVREKLFAG